MKKKPNRKKAQEEPRAEEPRDDDKLIIPERPKRAVITREETIRRMMDLPRRKDKIIAAIRKVED